MIISRFCELDLPRRELPAHENYCGVRTEQCADCGEYVMIKYRQLHVDSNHGFLRLDDGKLTVDADNVILLKFWLFSVSHVLKHEMINHLRVIT